MQYYPKDIILKNISHFNKHEEASEYGGCEYQYKNQKYIQRTAKITPKKTGQFVTLWKRDKKGLTTPYDKKDDLDFVIIICHDQKNSGHFLFPKKILIERKILTGSAEGKRGFRVYPNWDKPTSKQAISTQVWQIEYFHENITFR